MSLKLSKLLITLRYFSSSHGMNFFAKKEQRLITSQRELDDKTKRYQGNRCIKDGASLLALTAIFKTAAYMFPSNSYLAIVRGFLLTPEAAMILNGGAYFLTPYFNTLSRQKELALRDLCEDKTFHKHAINFEAMKRVLHKKYGFLTSGSVTWQHNLCCKQDSDTLDSQCVQVYQEIERFYDLAAIGAISFIPKDPSENVYDARCVRSIPGLSSIATSEIPIIYGTKVGLSVRFCLSKHVSDEDRRRFRTLFYDAKLEKQLTQKNKR